MRLTRSVLCSRLVKEKRGQASYQLAASTADHQPGLPVGTVGEIFAHQPPAGNAPVVGGSHRGHPGDRLHYLKAAFSAVLTAVPEVGRGDGKIDLLISAELGKPQGCLAEGESGDAELVGDVDPALPVANTDIGGEHIEAVVEGKDASACAWDGAFGANVTCLVELGKELTLENIPFAVKPGVTESRRQGLKSSHVVGVGAGENAVVKNRGGDKGVVLGGFTEAIIAVDEKPFDPGMTDAPGIAGEVDTPREIPSASKTSLEDSELILAQLRCFVDGNNVVFLTLIAEGVALCGAVAEDYTASVFESELAVALTVGEDRAVFRKKRREMV